MPSSALYGFENRKLGTQWILRFRSVFKVLRELACTKCVVRWNRSPGERWISTWSVVEEVTRPIFGRHIGRHMWAVACSLWICFVTHRNLRRCRSNNGACTVVNIAKRTKRIDFETKTSALWALYSNCFDHVSGRYVTIWARTERDQPTRQPRSTQRRFFKLDTLL